MIVENTIVQKKNLVMKFFENNMEINSDSTKFWFVIITYVTTVLIHYISAWAYYVIFSKQLDLFFSIIVINLIDELMYIQNSEFHNHESGKLSTIINRQAHASCKLLEIFILDFLPLIFLIFVSFISLYNNFPKIVFIIFLFLLILLLIYTFLTSILLNSKKKLVNFYEIIVKNKILEILKTFNIIKIYFQENKELENFKRSINSFTTVSIDYKFAFHTMSLGFRLILFFFNFISMIYFYYYKDKLKITVLTCINFYDYFGIFKKKISKIKNAFSIVRNSYIDIINVDINKTTIFKEKFINNTYFSKIEFKNLQFAYKNKLIFKNFNFIFKSGDKIAITGRNGQGKSTIINSILGFCNYKGDILIDNKIIIKDNSSSLRPMISYVAQDSCIKNTTVYENLIYGLKEDIGYNELEKVCIKFNYHYIFNDLKDGYVTNAGDGGKFLSGGQCQIINFLRAVIRDTPILILDEATSNLDYTSTYILLDNIFTNLKEKTVFYSTHDIGCLHRFDKILNINNGIITIYDNSTEFINLALKERLL